MLAVAPGNLQDKDSLPWPDYSMSLITNLSVFQHLFVMQDLRKDQVTDSEPHDQCLQTMQTHGMEHVHPNTEVITVTSHYD
jgi:hypothetical protein